MFKFLGLARLPVVALLAVSAVPAQAVEVISNGNFQSGLTGWTGFITAHGTISPVPGYAGGAANLPVVNSFNVSGSGASNALVLNAGSQPVQREPGRRWRYTDVYDNGWHCDVLGRYRGLYPCSRRRWPRSPECSARWCRTGLP